MHAVQGSLAAVGGVRAVPRWVGGTCFLGGRATVSLDLVAFCLSTLCPCSLQLVLAEQLNLLPRPRLGHPGTVAPGVLPAARSALLHSFPQPSTPPSCMCTQNIDLSSILSSATLQYHKLCFCADLRMEDVVVELTDLLRPADPHHITAADFERSGAAGTVIGLLADVNLFWEYENREALAQQAQQEQ